MINKIADKVLFIGADYQDTKGGISQLLNSYSRFLPSFHFVCSTHGGNVLRKFFTFLSSIFFVLGYIIFKDIQILHIHTSSFTIVKREYIYVLIGSFFHKKIILHLHGGMFEKECIMHAPKLKRIFKKVDVVLCVSDYLKEIVNKYNLSERVFTLHNIIDEPEISLEKTNEDNYSRVSFLFLGSIDENKGVFDILKVFVEKKEYLEDKIDFVIGGIGEKERLISIILDNDLGTFVHYKGWVNKKEKQKLYQQSDIYIQPSYYESFGLSLLEASSYGLAVISSYAGGIPDIIKNGYNGILIKPGDNNALWEAVKALIEDKGFRKKLGQNGVEYSKKFYPKSIVSDLCYIYNGLIVNE